MSVRNVAVTSCVVLALASAIASSVLAAPVGRPVSISANTYGAVCVGLASGDVLVGTVNGPWATRGNVFGGLPPVGDELAGAALNDYGLLVAVSRLGSAYALANAGWTSLGNVFGGATTDRVASITDPANGPIAVVTDAGDVYVRVSAYTWQKLSSIAGTPTVVQGTSFGALKNRYR